MVTSAQGFLYPNVSLRLEGVNFKVNFTASSFRKEEFRLIPFCGSQLKGRPPPSKEHVCYRGLKGVSEATTEIKAGGLY